ncbi:MAG: hypothetical protein ABJG15_15115 [Hyphomonadaceae bacterium]
MVRFALMTALFMSFAVPAFAQSDADRRARVERALNQLPDRADVEAAMDQLPNITGALTGLMDVATDEGNQQTLQGLVGRLENEFSGFEAQLSGGDIPDLNGMIERMMLLTTDRAFMGDALDLAFQVQDVMTDALPEASKP